MSRDYTGLYGFVQQENLNAYLQALDINLALRQIVCLLRPDKEIVLTGEHMEIKTLTAFRNYIMAFDIGVEFEEDLGPVDGRKCQTTVCWDGDRLVCTQIGEKKGRGWTHWLEGDLLYLEMRAEGVVAKQVFRRKK
ncbi:retinol-binding protein 1-like [Heterodontus francisci]|uniref:retinol-binding protein 1-like n=1 Tax=Heterodontus francisci TaxID=7792 RepID=UPI00355C0C2F